MRGVVCFFRMLVDKAALQAGGFDYPGHTEMLAELAGVPATMMLASDRLRVVSRCSASGDRGDREAKVCLRARGKTPVEAGCHARCTLLYDGRLFCPISRRIKRSRR